MAIKRFEGDNIRNPIYVLRDGNIPRKIVFPIELPNGKSTAVAYDSRPSIKYYPESDEFPEVPERLVIGAEDLRKLYPGEEIDDNALAYFVVKSIRTNLIQKFVDEFATGPFQFSGDAPGSGVGYYFVGEVEEARYCSGAPRIDYYTLNSERPLEVNLAGKGLEGIQKVYFQYPNGVVKEAEIIEGDTSESSSPIVTRNQIYRSLALYGIPTYEDEIEDWFFRNGYKLQVITLGQVSQGSEEGYSSNMPFFLNQEWIEVLRSDDLDINKFQFVSTEYTGVDVLNNIITLGLVSLFGDNQFSISKYKYSTSSGKTIWIAMSTGDALEYSLPTG